MVYGIVIMGLGIVIMVYGIVTKGLGIGVRGLGIGGEGLGRRFFLPQITQIYTERGVVTLRRKEVARRSSGEDCA